MNRWGMGVGALCAFALVGGFGARYLATDEQCIAAKKVAQDYNTRAPFSVDGITSLSGVDVDCDARIFQYRKQIGITSSELTPGWSERMAPQHRALHCNHQGLASVSGWTARDVVSEPNGMIFVVFETKPSDCS